MLSWSSMIKQSIIMLLMKMPPLMSLWMLLRRLLIFYIHMFLLRIHQWFEKAYGHHTHGAVSSKHREQEVCLLLSRYADWRRLLSDRYAVEAI